MQHMLREQYRLVCASRAVLLDYVRTMSASDFTSSSPAFGRGSVRNLLVHISDTYQHWIADQALQLGSSFPPFEQYTRLDQCRQYFERVNEVMDLFLERFAQNYTKPLPVQRSSGRVLISPLALFTHVTTHEFHHKGQIMSLSRELGYTPVDADIIR